jgi:hypothetical protein
MIDHLQQEVQEMLANAPKSESGNLRIINAIVSDATQLVRSSISDWGDVIGEELLAIERIKRLEYEKERLLEDQGSAKRDPEARAAEKVIEDAIETIQRTLPPRLRLEAESEGRLPKSSKRVAAWLARRHRDEGGLRMVVVTGDNYLSERDPKTLREGEILTSDKDRYGGMDVRDEAGLGVGRLMNLTPVPYDAFVAGMKACYDNSPVSLEFLRLKGEETHDDGLYVWLEVRVMTEPIVTVRRRPRSNR